jgi:hypothetical protein
MGLILNKMWNSGLGTGYFASEILAAPDGYVYVAVIQYGAGPYNIYVKKLDQSTLSIVGSWLLSSTGQSAELAVGGGNLFVLTNDVAGNWTLYKIDPSTMATSATLVLGANDDGIEYLNGNIFIGSGGTNPTLKRIDATTMLQTGVWTIPDLIHSGFMNLVTDGNSIFGMSIYTPVSPGSYLQVFKIDPAAMAQLGVYTSAALITIQSRPSAFDGTYLYFSMVNAAPVFWNLYQMRPSTMAVSITHFTGSRNQDSSYDGQYLYGTDSNVGLINQVDIPSQAIIYTLSVSNIIQISSNGGVIFVSRSNDPMVESYIMVAPITLPSVTTNSATGVH